jgi:hypothetical protein
MEQEDEIDLDLTNTKDFVLALKPKQKIQILLKYSNDTMTYSTILAIIAEEIAKDRDLLNEIGKEYKEMMKKSLVEKFESCRKMRLEAFQAVLNCHFKRLN